VRGSQRFAVPSSTPATASTDLSNARIQPPAPQSWGIQEMKRGFAPLHAPMGGIGEAELACHAWTLPDLKQGQILALHSLCVHLPQSYLAGGGLPRLLRRDTPNAGPPKADCTDTARTWINPLAPNLGG
jgi:hypothetical protein